MPVCCCYEKIDGGDYGCTTYSGDTCPAISGYTLKSQTSGFCNSLEEEMIKQNKDHAKQVIIEQLMAL